MNKWKERRRKGKKWKRETKEDYFNELMKCSKWLQMIAIFQRLLHFTTGDCCRADDHEIKSCAYPPKSKKWYDYHQTTRLMAQNRDAQYFPCTEDGKSRKSIETVVKNEIWSRHIMATKEETELAEIAHLVPATSGHAHTYWFVADFLYGVDTNRTWKSR